MADCSQNRQSAKINSPPKFPAIRYVRMYICVCVCLYIRHSQFGTLDCAIATNTQQREEQLEAILLPEVVVYSLSIPIFAVCFVQFSLHLSVGFIAA